MCLPSFLKSSSVANRLSRKGSRTQQREREGKEKKEEGELEEVEAPSPVIRVALMTAHITFIQPADFVKLRNSSVAVAVVDVRDEERQEDGHIAGSLYYPSSSFPEKMPDLLKDVKSKGSVVFHCAKSQVRGPTCARALVRYLKEDVSPGEKRPEVLVLERGFDGWAASGRPVCKCNDAPCTHKF